VIAKTVFTTVSIYIGSLMKGVIFTEFLELVESKFGMGVADQIQTKGFPLDSGFTSVGTYDYQILISLVVELSNETGIPIRDLVYGFGKHLFNRFRVIYPEFICGSTNTIDLLRNVESVIHIEVQKLYPGAELPSFKFPPSGDEQFQIEYNSARPFAVLAEGLIDACIEHFGDDLILERIDLDGEPGTHALFCLTPKSH
jgi:hypothetical protein